MAGKKGVGPKAGEVLGRGSGGVTGKGFMPGKSGNEGRRYSAKPLTEAFEKALKKAVSKKILGHLKRAGIKIDKDTTNVEALAESLVERAFTDTRSLDILLDRTEGKPLQGIRLENPDGDPIRGDEGADELKRNIATIADTIRARVSKSRGTR